MRYIISYRWTLGNIGIQNMEVFTLIEILAFLHSLYGKRPWLLFVNCHLKVDILNLVDWRDRTIYLMLLLRSYRSHNLYYLRTWNLISDLRRLS